MKKNLFTIFMLLMLGICSNISAQNIIKQCTPGGFYYSCGGAAAHQSEQGPWLDLVINGNQNSWYQGYGIESASWKEFDNGTAQLTARLYQIINKTNVKFDMHLTFSNKGASTPHGGGDGWHCLPSNTNDWYYYRTATGTVTGVAGTHVQGVTFTASLVGGSALQIGTGGSINSTTKYGMSAWLDLTQTGGWNVCWKKGGADIYFDLNNCTTVSTPLAALAFDPNKCYRFVNQCGWKVLDVVNNGSTNGTNVQVWDGNYGAAQAFNIVSLGNGAFKIVHKSSGKVLDVSGAATHDGANVHLWDFGSALNQQWIITSTGTNIYEIIAKHSGKALDVAGASAVAGANVQQYTKNGSCAQKWKIEEVSCPSTAAVCNNLTHGGTIGSYQSGCAPFSTTTINNITHPSGGDASKAIEYVWLKTIDPSGPTNLPTCDANSGATNHKSWTVISGANSESYSPGSVSQTTWYLRCARRAGCTCYFGESNIVKINITGNCNTGGSGTICAVLATATNNGPKCVGQTVQLSANGISNSTGGTTGTALGSNLVVNGGFNQGFTGFTTEIRRNTWADCNNGGSINVGATPHAAMGFAATCPDKDGNGAQLVVDFPAGDIWQKIWKQHVTVKSNTKYKFIFWAQSVYAGNPAKLFAMINDQVYPTTILPTTTCNWVKYEVDWNSGASTNAALIIKNNNPDCHGNDFAIDAISLQEVTTTSTPTCTPSYAWTGPNGFTSTQQNPTTTVAGTYTVTYKDQFCCTATASTTVNIANAATATITGNLQVCTGQTTTLTANGTGAYLWSNGSTAQTINVGAGTYSVEITSGAGCKATASATVTTVANPTATITGNLQVCAGQTTTLTANGTGVYLWSNGSTSQTINVGAGTYSVTITSGAGCKATASATVTTVANPTASITGGNTTVCNGGTTILTAQGGGTYSWSNGSTAQSITVGAGTYTVTVSNGVGCSATASATINNNNFSTSITGNLQICAGQTTTLTAQGGGTYSWSNGSTAQSITVGAGTYSVEVTNAQGCKATASTTVNQTANPTVTINGNLKVCNGATTVLTASGSGSFTWSNGATGQSVTVGAGTYTVTVSNGVGCSATASATVTNSNVTATITGEPTVCPGSTTTLTANGGNSYLWSNGATSQNINVGAGTYSVTVTNVQGCTATNSITVTNKNCNSSSVGDFVFCDKNANGVQDGTEPGIAGVTVTLSGTDTNGQPVTRTTTTDANGKYNFDNLPAGTYTVTFTKPNSYQSSNPDQGGNDSNDSDANPITGTSPSFTLGQGQNNSTIDAGFYQLSIIGNLVFDDKDNDGVQDAGELGIAGVTVKLTGTAGDGSPVNLTTITDANGNYQFTGLKPGNYTVNFTTPNGFSSSPKDQGGNDATDSDPDSNGNVTVMLGSGVTNNTIDAGFNKNPSAKIGDVIFCDKDADGVQDAGEPGVAGVIVTLMGTTSNGQFVNKSTTTDANGKYLFDGLVAGSYKIIVAVPNGYLLTGKDKGGNDATDSDVDPSSNESPLYTLTDGQANLTVDAGLYQLGSIGDKVFDDKDKDGVQDAGEPGIANVKVTLTGTTGDGSPINMMAFTDVNGNYKFNNLKPGNYIVSFEKPNGFTAGSPQDASGNDDTDSDANPTTGTTANIPLQGGQNITNVDAGFFISNTASLGDYVFCDKNGNGVQDAGDTPLAGVTVTLTGTTASGQTVTKTAVTDATGKYSFTGLAAGTYKLTFGTLAGYVSSPSDKGGNDATDSDAINGMVSNIVLAAGQNNPTIDAGFYQLSTIGNFVFDDKDNDGVQDAGELGIAGVTVTLTGTAGDGSPVSMTVVTDANGNYQFTNVKPGAYTLNFGKPTGFNPSPKDQGGNDATDSDPDASGNVPVTVTSGTTNTTVDAGFNKPVVNNASLGDYVFCDKNGNGVQDAGDTPLVGVTVTLTGTTASGQTVTKTAVTDATGKYSFTGLAAGTYKVTFGTLAGYVSSPSDKGGNDATDSDAINGMVSNIVLAAGQNNPTIDAGFYQLSTIGNFVFDDKNNNGVQDAGEPGLAGVTVKLTGTAGDGSPVSMTVVTDANGNYQFTNVKPGTYTLNFGKPTGFNPSLQNVGTDDNADSDPDASGNVPVTVTSGTTNTTVDAGFNKPAPALGSIGDIVFNDLDKDGVQDAGETGIPNVTIILNGTVNGNPITLVTTTDANGKYNFPNLQPGSYTLTFQKPAGYTASPADQGGNDATDSDANPTTGVTPSITIGVGTSNTTIDAGFYLTPIATNVTIGDFVFLDCNKNGMQDINEAGIANVKVELRNAAGTIVATTTTNTSGAYSFTVPSGSYKVCFKLPTNYTGLIFSPKDLGGNDTKDSDVNTLGETDLINFTANNNTIDAGIIDNIAPVFNNFPANVTVACTAIPATPNVMASDNYDASVTIMKSTTTELTSITGQYLLKHTYKAVDRCGNVTEKTWIVCVKDTNAPTFVSFPTDKTVECNAIPAVEMPVVSDACDSSPEVDYDQTIVQGSCVNNYTIKRIWTVTDAAGNKSTKTQTITVKDTKAPVITGVPADVTITCGQAIPLPPAPGIVKATDNCDAFVNTQFSEIFFAGDCDGKGMIKCQWLAKDKCGNISTKIWTITIFTPAQSLQQNTNNTPNSLLNATGRTEIQEATQEVVFTNNDVNVFPNPTYGDATILLGDVKASRINVVNEIGQIIQTIEQPTEKIELNLARGTKGLYTIQIYTATGILTKKLVVVE